MSIVTAIRRRVSDDAGLAIMVAVLAIAARLPFRSEFLVNWDAVNFALGIEAFDLATHQPHPPGYLGWVALSRMVTTVTNDPNAAMTLLSSISGAVAAALMYLLARRYASRRASVVTALLFSTAPLIWYYSVVALSYMTTGAIALGLLYALVRALEDRSPRHLVVASLLLAGVGALRPTDQVLLGLAWLVVVWTFDWASRIRAAAALGLATLAWVVPLLWLSGGVGAFRGESSAVAGLAGGRTWIFGGNLAGIGQNIGMVGAGLLLGLFGGLVVVLLARSRGIRPYASLPTDERRLLLAWVGPPLFVYLALHTGQLGYVLLLLPVVYLGVARALHGLWEEVRRLAGRLGAIGSAPFHRRQPVMAIGVLLAANTVAFLVLPPTGLRLVEAAAPAPTSDDDSPVRPAALDRTRQYDVRANDQHWQRLTRLIDRYDAAWTAVVAETSSAGSFRHLSYYAPDVPVYGVGWDRRGDLGYLFRAQERETTYSVERLDETRRTLVLPEDVRTVIIPDEMLSARLVESTPTGHARMTEVETGDGVTVTVVQLAGPSVVVFSNPEGDGELRPGFQSNPGNELGDDGRMVFSSVDDLGEDVGHARGEAGGQAGARDHGR